MERAAYALEADVEGTHWWFVGRRSMFARELRKAGVDRNSAVLDIGVSTGANLRMLRELGFDRVVGLDNNAQAAKFCAEKGVNAICLGDVCALPFPHGSFDLILATDIIEHVDDDAGALREISRVLRPGGKLLLTVPAFMSLWGLQDRIAHHKRRYRLRQLRSRLTPAGLRPVRTFYFNYLLFAPIWLARRLIDWLGLKLKNENQINGPLLNRLLSIVFGFDTLTAPFLRVPFGVSILVLAERPGTD